MPFDLIKTKYCRPGISPNLLPRKRLSEKLDGALGYRLTFVSAPAGYGKTTAVLEIFHRGFESGVSKGMREFFGHSRQPGSNHVKYACGVPE